LPNGGVSGVKDGLTSFSGSGREVGGEASLSALQAAYRQMAAFSRCSGRIVQEDDFNTACRLFLEAVREHSGYGRAVLTLLDDQGKDSQWFFTGLSDGEIDYFHGHKMNPGQRPAAFQDRFRIGSSYLVPASPEINYGGLRPGGRVTDRSEKEPARHLLFIPLYGARGALAGTLMLDDPDQGIVATTEALSSLELFASQVAHAIEKKRFDLDVRKMQARLRAAQEQLMQAEKMSAIGQLISGVAHELNNPLAGIMGFAQLVLSTELNPKIRQNLERIYSEAVRSQKIVQNLLGFSRRHQPEKAYRNLNETIDSVLELRAYQLQVDNVEVVRRYDPDLPNTMLDFHQIQQVVLNLVNNAHQAMMEMQDRHHRLVISTSRKGDLLHAAFSDNGPGIPPDRLETIFEPFFTTKKEGKGTGLGLSLSRAIVRDHLGTMSVESVVGEGTTFHIDLPLLEEQRAGAPAHAEEAPVGPQKPMRLLVVDDERILVELLCEFLKSFGHHVEEACDGRRALEIARAKDFDVILTDLKMPGLDGQGFYERLLQTKPDMARRFIFSTGDLANPKVQSFFQATGCLYLSKPFKLEAVLKLLDQLSRDQRAA
jgi:signal transduction histidine kinase/ActR/RegA family two-component response regulator